MRPPSAPEIVDHGDWTEIYVAGVPVALTGTHNQRRAATRAARIGGILADQHEEAPADRYPAFLPGGTT